VGKAVGLQPSEIVSLNPTEGMLFPALVFVVCCAGSGLCDELMTHSEVSCRVCGRPG